MSRVVYWLLICPAAEVVMFLALVVYHRQHENIEFAPFLYGQKVCMKPQDRVGLEWYP